MTEEMLIGLQLSFVAFALKKQLKVEQYLIFIELDFFGDTETVGL